MKQRHSENSNITQITGVWRDWFCNKSLQDMITIYFPIRLTGGQDGVRDGVKFFFERA